jgi:hypothetical protein
MYIHEMIYFIKNKIFRFGFLLIVLLFTACEHDAPDVEKLTSLGPYPGSRILGNGTFCFSASGFPRNGEEVPGIQTLYVNDYTRNFVKSIRLELKGSWETEWITSTSDPYFAEATQWEAGPLNAVTRLYALPDPDMKVIVWEGRIVNTGRRKISFRIEPVFEFARPSAADYGEKQVQYLVDELILTAGFTDARDTDVDDGRFSRPVTLAPSEDHRFSLLMVISENQLQGQQTWDTLAVKDLRRFARRGWDAWLAEGMEPSFQSPEDSLRFRTNLLSVKALNLNGAVPADITGQFVTNDLPQLYPRDALMTARMFLETGHLQEVKQILDYWANVPFKSTGEWFARYDAFGRATEGGSGARYDVPEWDSNGYYTTLVYEAFLQHRIWIGDFKLVQDLLTFVELRLGPDGLVHEGGILEWPGKLPSTNMSLAAAFRQAAFLAKWRNQKQLARRWVAVAERMDEGLARLFDPTDKTYKDMRDHAFSWNTSALFGWIWGYEDHLRLQLSSEYWWNQCRKTGDGIQYFEGEGYGDDLFGFTTGALAQYYAAQHRKERYLLLKTWFDRNSNVYGLIPERVHYPVDDEKISEASPLTWCSAEYVMVLVEGARHLMISEDIQATERRAIKLCQNAVSAQIPFQDTLTRRECLDYLKDVSFWWDNFIREKEKINALFEAASLKKHGITLAMDPYPLKLISPNAFDIPFRLTMKKPVQRVRVQDRYATRNWRIRTPRVSEGGIHTVRVMPFISMPVIDHYGYFLLEWIFSFEDFTVPLSFPVHYQILAPYQISLKDTLVVDDPVFQIFNRSKAPLEILWMEDTLAQTHIFPPDYQDTFVISLPDSGAPQDSLNVIILFGNDEHFEKFSWTPCREVDLSEGWEFSPVQQVNQCFKLRRDDSLWFPVQVPANWENAGFPDLDGTFWYRRFFSLPDSLHDTRIWLDMGAVDDEDETYINCDKVGSTAGWNLPRRYLISPGKSRIVWNLKNTLLVKVTDYGNGGGIYKGPVRLLIEK